MNFLDQFGENMKNLENQIPAWNTKSLSQHKNCFNAYNLCQQDILNEISTRWRYV